jgi:hypothetical protein
LYNGFLDSQLDSKEQCWSFHSVPPLAYGKKTKPDTALCEDHKTTEHFTVDKFLPYLYFSVVTSTTVGYGDVSPLSVSAAWIVIIHHLIAIVLFVVVVAQLGNFTISPASS